AAQMLRRTTECQPIWILSKTD
ncbi:MMPL family protein, partial [Vibrio parahaemolyticus 861]